MEWKTCNSDNLKRQNFWKIPSSTANIVRHRQFGGNSCTNVTLNKAHLYGSMNSFALFDPNRQPDQARNGVFGIDFSPDGRYVCAATENRSLLFFDPLKPPDPTLVAVNAHTNCVNCVKFLDNRLFVSASDDHTAKLWDVRQMRCEIRTFRGHTSWIKNVEFFPDRALLLTAAFDQRVLAWDINDPSAEPRQLLNIDGLMRMRLTAQCDKMIIATQYGYLIVIHNLNLDTVQEDLQGFKPNTYWISIETQSLFPPAKKHIARFTAHRNRIEMIMDFSENCEPDHISSVTTHPEGWAVLSRMNNLNNQNEWTTVHDIQLPALERPKTDDSLDEAPDLAHIYPNSFAEDTPYTRRLRLSGRSPFRLPLVRTVSPTDRLYQSTTDSSQRTTMPSRAANLYNSSVYNFRFRYADIRGNTFVGSAGRTTVVVVTDQDTASQNPAASPLQDSTTLSSSSSSSAHSVKSENNIDDSNRAPKTYKRLIGYKEEPRQGRGFIKENAWCPRGRLIASPYGFGLRLLSFDAQCSDMSEHCWKDVDEGPKKYGRELHELKTVIGPPNNHSEVVLCAKFSPTHEALLVAGCLHGAVSFSQPKL